MATKFTILGSGSSFGIPRIDGYFGKCNSNLKKRFFGGLDCEKHIF